MDIITSSYDKTIFLTLAVCHRSKDAEIIKPIHSYWGFWWRIVIGEKKDICPTCRRLK